MLARIAIWFAVLCTGVLAAPGLIDRQALVTRHNPVIREVDPTGPLTVGNGGFAFTVDITGLQTFGDYYHQNGIPLETLARWCWVTDGNPQDYTLADANQNYLQADGSTISLSGKLDNPASDWLRRNPRLQPLGQISLEWDKPDGTPFVPEDVQEPEQILNLWNGIVTSRFKLGGTPVTVETACAPDSDTVALRIVSDLVVTGKLRVRLAFPRGHNIAVKNTPDLDWSQPESHTSLLVNPDQIERRVQETIYYIGCERPLASRAPHVFFVSGDKGSNVLETAFEFSRMPQKIGTACSSVFVNSAAHWGKFWRSAAAVDFSGSTSPLATKLEERVVLSQYLLAVQMAGEMPPQESGLTCNTWYGKHHTEMIWWHSAHFALWGSDALLAKNLAWFQSQRPARSRRAAD